MKIHAKFGGGILAFLIGLWTLLPISIYGLGWYKALWVVFQGAIGPVLMAIGVLVAWIEFEELKTEAPLELEEEESKESEKKSE